MGVHCRLLSRQTKFFFRIIKETKLIYLCQIYFLLTGINREYLKVSFLIYNLKNQTNKTTPDISAHLSCMFSCVFGALCTYSPRATGWQGGLGALLVSRDINPVTSAFDERHCKNTSIFFLLGLLSVMGSSQSCLEQ